MAQIDFTGNLGADAELRHTKEGRPRLGFRIADTKSKPDGNGGWEKLKEQWINVSLWGEPAEFYGPKLVKGARVRVFGEFFAREYEGKDGGKGISLDVDAQGVFIYPPRNNRQQSAPPANSNGGWNAPAGNTGGWGNPGQDSPPF